MKKRIAAAHKKLVIIDADVNGTISLCCPAACFYFPIMVVPAFPTLATHFIQADMRFIIATIVHDRNVRASVLQWDECVCIDSPI